MSLQRAALKDRLHEALVLRGKRAIDLTRDLKIPKAAASQYLSGKSQNMDSERLHKIAVYLDVSEPWLLGFDVPRERQLNKEEQKKNDIAVDIAVRLQKDEDFLSVVTMLNEFDSEKLQKARQILQIL